jgi:hypothetical protein
MDTRLAAAFACLALAACVGYPGRDKDYNDLRQNKKYTLLPKYLPLPRGSVNYDCGPEAVSAVLKYHGRNIPVDHIAKEIYSAPLRGTLVHRLLEYFNDCGFRATPVEGSLVRIKQAIHAGRPVILMVRMTENLAHFFVVAGFSDEDGKLVVLHYDLRVGLISYSDLERMWEPADRFMVEPVAITRSLEIARRFEDQKRFQEAVQHYRKAAAEEPENHRVWTGLGTCCLYVHDVDGALEAFSRGYALYRQDAQLLNNYAHALLEKGREPDLARELASEAVRMYEGLRSQLLRAIQASKPEGKVELEAYEERVRLNLAFALGTLGQACEASRRHEEGAAAYLQSLELLPRTMKKERGRRLRDIGRCLRELGEIDRAVEYERMAEQEETSQ